MLCDNWLVGRTQAGDAVSLFADGERQTSVPGTMYLFSTSGTPMAPTCQNPDEWMETAKRQRRFFP